jgi:hypothetical protein
MNSLPVGFEVAYFYPFEGHDVERDGKSASLVDGGPNKGTNAPRGLL